MSSIVLYFIKLFKWVFFDFIEPFIYILFNFIDDLYDSFKFFEILSKSLPLVFWEVDIGGSPFEASLDQKVGHENPSQPIAVNSGAWLSSQQLLEA
jgi:hypothetical protein